MIRWLWKIIVGKPACARECFWETQGVTPVYWDSASKRPHAFDYEMRCKTCGEIKVKRT